MRDAQRPWRRGVLVLSCLIAAVCILLLITSYQARHNSDNLPAAEAAVEPVAAAHPAAVSIAADQTQWRYSTERNAAGEAERVGCVDSGGVVFLGEPYNSEHASLCFRRDGMAFLKLDGEGRIESGAGYDAKLQIGDGPVERIATLKPDDQSLGLAILSPAAPLLAAARSGKRITLTATYDEDVTQALTFAPHEPLHLDN
jgi:hypothetical protein